MRDLTVLEQIILASIINLGSDAYGVSIRKKVRKHTGKVLMYGTLYKGLDQMFRKGYVTKVKGKSTEDRDGSKKVFYTVTPKGKKSLEVALKLNKAIQGIIPDFINDCD